MKISAIIAMFFVASQTLEEGVKLRDHEAVEENHESFYQWKGGKCDHGCRNAGGRICGTYFKDCCSAECEGWVLKTCNRRHLIKNISCKD